jgi:hypothetical protein
MPNTLPAKTDPVGSFGVSRVDRVKALSVVPNLAGHIGHRVAQCRVPYPRFSKEKRKEGAPVLGASPYMGRKDRPYRHCRPWDKSQPQEGEVMNAYTGNPQPTGEVR